LARIIHRIGKVVNKPEISGIAVPAPANTLGHDRAAAGCNDHFVSCVLGRFEPRVKMLRLNIASRRIKTNG
jgi:hypothetical protein